MIFRYQTATAVCTLEHGLSRVFVTGVVTPSVGAQILADNAAWLRRSGATGQVADYRRAAMAIDADALFCAARNAAAKDPALDTPTALVLQAHDMELFDAYSSMVAIVGLTRAPFVDADRAAAWAARQAAAARHLPMSRGALGREAGRREPAGDLAEPRRTAAQVRLPGATTG